VLIKPRLPALLKINFREHVSTANGVASHPARFPSALRVTLALKVLYPDTTFLGFAGFFLHALLLRPKRCADQASIAGASKDFAGQIALCFPSVATKAQRHRAGLVLPK
jgi:hypothetical protein